jgi:mono/diheme cytochrome c family protein
MDSRIKILILAAVSMTAGVLFAQQPPATRNPPGADPAANAMAATGDPAAGEAVFYGKAACATCHEVNGRGGIDGPDLSNAGRLAVAALHQKIVDPNTPLPPAPGAAGAGRGGFPGGGGGRGGGGAATVIVKMPPDNCCSSTKRKWRR